jgi:hypothetical protein
MLSNTINKNRILFKLCVHYLLSTKKRITKDQNLYLYSYIYHSKKIYAKFEGLLIFIGSLLKAGIPICITDPIYTSDLFATKENYAKKKLISEHVSVFRPYVYVHHVACIIAMPMHAAAENHCW